MTHDFQSVRALLRHSDPVTRQIVTGALGNHGCRKIVAAEQDGEMEHYLKADMVDLLVCDADQGLEQACDTIRQMRNRADGDNSFALSILLTSRPAPESMVHLIDSGADSILVKPFQPAALILQIDSLIRARRPFIVTSNYVGPERRGDGIRPGSESAPRVPVPNPLRETVLRSASRDELRRKVRHAWEVVNEHRIERQMAQLAWLVNKIRAALARKPPAPDSAALLNQLLHCASELRLRVAGTNFDHVAHLATTMIEICYGLAQSVENPDSRWLAVLPKVADAMVKAFTRERDAVHSSREISETVSTRFRAETAAEPRPCH